MHSHTFLDDIWWVTLFWKYLILLAINGLGFIFLAVVNIETVDFDNYYHRMKVEHINIFYRRAL